MKKTSDTILITGGAGFIGSHMVDFWKAKGAKVVVIDNLSTGNQEWFPSGIEFIESDLTKTTQLSAILSIYKPKIIHHFAGHTRIREAFKDPKKDATDNLMSTVSLVQACLSVRQKFGYQPNQIVFSSTSAVFAGSKLPPFTALSRVAANSPYGISKLAAEEYLAWYHNLTGVTTTVLRYANVYGPRQSNVGEAGVIAKFVEALTTHEALTIFGNGTHQRDYIFVSDVVAANAAVVEKSCQGTFVVGTGVPTSTKELAQLCVRLQKGAMVDYDTKIPLEQPRSWLDSSALTLSTGWKPKVKLKDGLNVTLRWYVEMAKK